MPGLRRCHCDAMRFPAPRSSFARKKERLNFLKARRPESAWETLQASPAKECDAALSRRLLGVVETVTGSRLLLPSGAGHDAAILASLFPVTMLFVRCR